MPKKFRMRTLLKKVVFNLKIVLYPIKLSLTEYLRSISKDKQGCGYVNN